MLCTNQTHAHISTAMSLPFRNTLKNKISSAGILSGKEGPALKLGVGFVGEWWCHRHQTRGLRTLITECWGNFITEGFSAMVDGRVWSPGHWGAPAAQRGDTWATCAATWPSKPLHWKYDYEGALLSERHPKIQRNMDLWEHLSPAVPGNPAGLGLSPAKSRARHSVTYMCMARASWVGVVMRDKPNQCFPAQIPTCPEGCAGTAVSCRAPLGLQGAKGVPGRDCPLWCCLGSERMNPEKRKG